MVKITNYKVIMSNDCKIMTVNYDNQVKTKH